MKLMASTHIIRWNVPDPGGDTFIIGSVLPVNRVPLLYGGQWDRPLGEAVIRADDIGVIADCYVADRYVDAVQAFIDLDEILVGYGCKILAWATFTDGVRRRIQNASIIDVSLCTAGANSPVLV